MNRPRFKKRALSLLLSAAVAIPSVAVPVQILAQDGSEENFEEMTEESPVSEAGDVTLESSDQEFSINLSSGITTSTFSVPSYPGDQTKAAEPIENQDGILSVSLDLSQLLSGLPDFFNKYATDWKNAYGWPVESVLTSDQVNNNVTFSGVPIIKDQLKPGEEYSFMKGLPVQLTIALPENTKFIGDARYKNDTENKYRFDQNKNSVGGSIPTTATAGDLVDIKGINYDDDHRTANITILFNAVAYKEFLEAIQNKTAGQLVFDLPFQYSVEKGEDLTQQKVAISGTAPNVAHKTGVHKFGPFTFPARVLQFGVSLDEMTPALFTPVEEPVVGTVNDQIGVTSSLAVNGSDSAAVKVNEPFTLTGKLDVRNIAQTLQKKIKEYGINDELLKEVGVTQTNLNMTAKIELPDQVQWTGTKDDLTLDSGSVDHFTVTEANREGNILTVQFELTNDQIQNLQQLVDIMNSVGDEMTLTIPNLSASASTNGQSADLSCTVSGTFSSYAEIPDAADGGKTPGLYQITYTMVDAKSEPAQLTVTAPSNPGGGSGGGSGSGGGATVTKTVDLYRLYNPNSGEHFYTQNAGEKDSLVEKGWKYEGVGWTSPTTSDYPVYRLYNPNAGDHHFTLDANERDVLTTVGWQYEGISWYSLPANQGVKVYREYNPNAKEAGAHNYTTNKVENDYLISVGWLDEGIGWWAVK